MELKLALYPEKYFPEGLIHGDIVIDKGTIEEFITISMDNIGRGNISFLNEVFSKAKNLIRLFFYYDKSQAHQFYFPVRGLEYLVCWVLLVLYALQQFSHLKTDNHLCQKIWLLFCYLFVAGKGLDSF